MFECRIIVLGSKFVCGLTLHLDVWSISVDHGDDDDDDNDEDDDADENDDDDYDDDDDDDNDRDDDDGIITQTNVRLLTWNGAQKLP